MLIPKPLIIILKNKSLKPSQRVDVSLAKDADIEIQQSLIGNE